MIRLWHATVALVAVLGSMGSLMAADAGDAEDELESLRAAIIKLIGQAPCANLVRCRLLALGTRPCGGPDEYLAYSSITVQRIVLENKAVEYGLLQEELQRAGGAAGACVMLPEPRLACVGGRCRAE